MTLAVAFFRNLNLGHRGSPSRPELESAFVFEGAGSVRSFQTNGTVILEAANPTPLARRAARRLRDGCGWEDYVAVRSAGWCRGLAARLARDFSDEEQRRLEISFFDSPRVAPLPRCGPTPDGRVDLREVTFRHAVSLPVLDPGSATPALERLLPCPVTSRSGGTILRLARVLAGR